MRKTIAAAVAAAALALSLTACATSARPVALDRDATPTAAATAAATEAAAAVVVPETAGMTARQARASLEAVGLEVEYATDKGFVVDQDNWTVLSTTPAAGDTVPDGTTIVVSVTKTANLNAAATPAAPAAPAAPQFTLAQENAIESAQSYLSFTGFSRAGLFEQLTSQYGEGFSAEDAEFALAHLEQNSLVDWNAEAVESAKSYLDFSSFSHDGLYEQLTSEYGEGFTPDQANYALATIGL